MAFQTLLWTSFFCVTVSEVVNYEDLQSLGVACYPRDTCNAAWKAFPNTSCECDNLCLYYNDCCLNAPVVTRDRRVQRLVGLTCLQYRRNEGVYAVGRCPRSWRGSQTVRRKCEDQDDFSDPFLSMAVTDNQAYITYRNRYCAECNNANHNDLTTWSPTFTCDSLRPVNPEYNTIFEDYFIRNIVRVGSNWGVYYWNESRGDVSFHPCRVSFSRPRALEQHFRYCVPDLISTCDTDWRHAVVQRRCASYTAVVFFNGQAYRNAHCALCNFASLRTIQCLPPFSLSDDSSLLSLAIHVDANPRNGGITESANSCPSGQYYDPFFNTCRNLA